MREPRVPTVISPAALLQMKKWAAGSSDSIRQAFEQQAAKMLVKAHHAVSSEQ